jgi:pilus assembly protein Flp/PilA
MVSAPRSATILPSPKPKDGEHSQKAASAAFGTVFAKKWFHNSKWGGAPMKNNLLKLASRMRILLNEEGQDLIEYALVVALIAFSATAGMSSVAAAINTAFNGIGTTLGSYIT